MPRRSSPSPANAAENMRRWAPEVRETLLQATFVRRFGWKDYAGDGKVILTWGDRPFVTLHSPTPKTLATQVKWVRHYAEQRADRADEILSQTGMFGEYFAVLLGMTPDRNARTYDFLDIVQGLAGDATMMPKHILACRRPDEIDGRIVPLLPAPGHGAFPSGHATQAFALATVLAGLIEACPSHFADPVARTELVFAQAHRIAVNRTVAGLHFPVDSRAGAVLGMQIGRIILGLAGRRVAVTAAQFDPQAVADKDFRLTEAKEVRDHPTGGAAVKVTGDPLFAWFWTQCLAEFAVEGG